MIASDLAYRIAAYAVSRRMRYWYARTRNAAYTVYGARRIRIERMCCLEFIGTQFSILYTSMYSLYVYGAVCAAYGYAIRGVTSSRIRYTRTRNAAYKVYAYSQRAHEILPTASRRDVRDVCLGVSDM